MSRQQTFDNLDAGFEWVARKLFWYVTVPMFAWIGFGLVLGAFSAVAAYDWSTFTWDSKVGEAVFMVLNVAFWSALATPFVLRRRLTRDEL